MNPSANAPSWQSRPSRRNLVPPRPHGPPSPRPKVPLNPHSKSATSAKRSEGVLVLAGIAAGLLAFAAAVAVFAGWRRNAARAVFRALAALSASAFLAFYLPLLILPEAAVNWWFD